MAKKTATPKVQAAAGAVCARVLCVRMRVLRAAWLFACMRLGPFNSIFSRNAIQRAHWAAGVLQPIRASQILPL